jgi:outer membrane protein
MSIRMLLLSCCCAATIIRVPSIAAQQRTAILSITDAIQSVIDRHPLIRYQEAQVEIDLGLKEQASSVFDTVLNTSLSQSRTTTPLTNYQQEEYSLIGAPGTDELTDTSQINAGFTRLFRSGITVAPSVTIIRNVDNIANPQGVNTASPNVQLTIPLLRGRGRNAVAAQEMAAGEELSASSFDLTNEITSLLSSMATDYWTVVANQQLVAIAKEAEARARLDYDNTQTLVAADRLPRENLNDVNASMAQSASSRIAAEQTLLASQYQLATDIGMEPQNIESILLVATDGFPSPIASDTDSVPNYSQLRSFIQLALDNRSDYIASGIRIKEQNMLVAAAKNRLLPQLNITLSGGYNGLQEGRRFKDIFDSTGNGLDGPNAAGGLAYSFAPRNNQARGTYLQAVATETQLQSQHVQLLHAISSSVASSVQAVRNAALETDKAHAAVSLYRASLEGQRDKYHVGMASVVDVLTVEDRLTTSLITEVQAQLSYALALTALRSATGTIVPPGRPVHNVDAAVFDIPPTPQSVIQP